MLSVAESSIYSRQGKVVTVEIRVQIILEFRYGNIFESKYQETIKAIFTAFLLTY